MNRIPELSIYRMNEIRKLVMKNLFKVKSRITVSPTKWDGKNAMFIIGYIPKNSKSAVYEILNDFTKCGIKVHIREHLSTFKGYCRTEYSMKVIY